MYLEVTITNQITECYFNLWSQHRNCIIHRVSFCHKFKIYNSPTVWLPLFDIIVSVLISSFWAGLSLAENICWHAVVLLCWNIGTFWPNIVVHFWQQLWIVCINAYCSVFPTKNSICADSNPGDHNPKVFFIYLKAWAQQFCMCSPYTTFKFRSCKNLMVLYVGI
jgi:hypothetical protein